MKPQPNEGPEGNQTEETILHTTGDQIIHHPDEPVADEKDAYFVSKGNKML